MRALLLGLLAGGSMWLSDPRVQRAPEVDTVLIGGPTRLITRTTPEMSAATLDAYRDWSRRPAHFGAFAVSPGGAYGYTKDYNSGDAAEAGALAYCAEADCRIIALSIPGIHLADGSRAIIVSRPTAEIYELYLKQPASKALAIHPAGASGSWIGSDTLANAYDGAVAECERWYQTNPSVPEAELDGCQVVHARDR